MKMGPQVDIYCDVRALAAAFRFQKKYFPIL